MLRILFLVIASIMTCCFSTTVINLVDPTKFPSYYGPTFEIYSGYLLVDPPNDGNLFFTFVPSTGNKVTDPFVIWLSGGPGCSSMIAFAAENGPIMFTSDDNGKPIFEANPYSWSNVANMLYIDNPIGAGFSYNDNSSAFVSTATEAVQQVLEGLKLFFRLPGMAGYQNNNMYAFGESYGGKYVLALATLMRNQPQFNFKGIGIGNGWVAPDIQQRVYSKLGYVTGFSNYYEYVTLNLIDENCHLLILNNSYFDAQQSQCIPLWLKVVKDAGNINAYDYRLIGTYPFLDSLNSILSGAEFIEAIKADSGGQTNAAYIQCSDQLFNNFDIEFQKSYTYLLPALLSQYKVVIYNGQFDLRCCVYGTSEWLRTLPWSGQASFNYMNFSPFISDGTTVVGLYKTYQNLSQVVVFDAGHLSPRDQPQATLEMLSRFTMANSFNSSCSQEPCQPLECPNECSGRGKCSNGVCECGPEFSAPDCSIALRTSFQLFGKTERFSGKLFGQTPHLYHLLLDPIDFNNTDILGYFDVEVTLVKTSNYGKIHVYIGGGQNYIQPDLTSNDALLAQFQWHNLNDMGTKHVVVSDIPRTQYPRITIMVMNGIDTTATYDIAYESHVSGPTANMTTIVLGLLVASGILLATILGLIIMMQVTFGVGVSKKTMSYLTE